MTPSGADPERTPVGRLIGWCLDAPLVVFLTLGLTVLGGLLTAPFPWELGDLPRRPVPVDAIPDTGDNQQIVFTEWPGRSPQDVEDQVTYPLTVALLGVPGVESVRSTSMFGFSSVQVIFGESIDFYWARSRILEKLGSLPGGSLPEEVEPSLGPDATALGQVFWYTLEGWADAEDDAPARPVGGFGLEELRSVQDWQVRYALSAVPGVAEVASIGGYVREYQVDVDPDAMRAHGVTLAEVFQAVRGSNLDVGARTLELNRAEYVVRGLGFVKTPEDLERAVVHVEDGTPITLREVARVGVGPALRRGALDKAGAEAVGGVVVARFGANPLEVIDGIHAALEELEPSLPRRTLEDGTQARIRVVPFYDRSGLIRETLGTLEDALSAQVLVTIAVVLVMIARLRPALLVAGLLPVAVLATFGGMKLAGVDANVVALSGIAIAIGGIVDMSIVLVESVGQHSAPDDGPRERLAAIRRGSAEVGGAVLTAVLTTVVGFLPVFAMTGPEGKLFGPLAWTKTLALVASIVLALTVLPVAAGALLGVPDPGRAARVRRWLGAVAAAAAVGLWLGPVAGGVLLGVLVALALLRRLEEHTPRLAWAVSAAGALAVLVLLARTWEPAGPARDGGNLLLAAVLLGIPLAGFWLFERVYEPALRWCLDHKALFLTLPALVVLFGTTVWLGFDRVFGWLPDPALRSRPAVVARHALPGLGREFMPALDEGSFLLMPVTMPHASIGEALELLQLQDRRIAALPEVKSVVGKIGRVESALDPAPVSMVETLVDYHPEYRADDTGRVLTFAWDSKTLAFLRDERGGLIADPDGKPFRQWRPEIGSPRDIWDAVAAAAQVPGMTTASMLQPIETRQIMLQTGLRAPIGIKVFGPDLESLEQAASELERVMRQAPGVDAATVLADRVAGKPYLEIDLDRERLARYGLSVAAVQEAIEVAIGGRPLTTTVEGRERYPVRVRYPRELRDTPEALAAVLIGAPSGAQVPLGQLADLRYSPGPQSIRSEETQLVAYVTFAGRRGTREVEVVEDARAYLDDLRASGALELPAGVRYRFAGQFENQVRAAATLRLVVPIALVVIFLLLFLLFRRVWVTAIVFSGVAVAWAGGFCLLWLWGRDGFLDLSLAGVSLAELFQVGPVALSVAVWVGFLALFGIATDDGVLMATYLEQRFAADRPSGRDGIREATVQAALRRIRPCLMTSATTVLALIPVLTSSGRGSDVMVPMALPTFGGMLVVLLTVFATPTLYCWVRERAA